jgi:IS5 family transposase
VLLRQSAQLHDLSEHAAIDATFYDRSPASRHYCQRIGYRVQKLKVTKIVDTARQAVIDVHFSINREGSDADLAEQIARRNAGDLRSQLGGLLVRRPQPAARSGCRFRPSSSVD